VQAQRPEAAHHVETVQDDQPVPGDLVAAAVGHRGELGCGHDPLFPEECADLTVARGQLEQAIPTGGDGDGPHDLPPAFLKES